MTMMRLGVEKKDNHSTIRHSNHGNVAMKVKPFPSEAYKIAPR